jgi:hypothetical protein
MLWLVHSLALSLSVAPRSLVPTVRPVFARAGCASMAEDPYCTVVFLRHGQSQARTRTCPSSPCFGLVLRLQLARDAVSRPFVCVLQWNEANLFTGWADVELTTLGKNEAAGAATQLWKEGITLDVAYTSRLKRAQQTLDIVLKITGQEDLQARRTSGVAPYPPTLVAVLHPHTLCGALPRGSS